MLVLGLIALAYLSGSIPYGVIVTRLGRGVDVRSAGSGNIGATNVARVAGKKLGALVLVLDALKGTMPVLLALVTTPDLRVHAAVGVAAFLGHVFPPWLKFKGGKGVATALGVLAVLTPWAALGGFVIFVALVAIFRIASVGSLAGAMVTVALAWLISPHWEYAALSAVLFVMMLYTHRGNISRLIHRSEAKL
ncbi:MAG: glycerol-3-phosphate 1-O-acyltransferase PlsY [Myxococcaceae bacterium]|nr:glycerol-3-phosphate 1-O-acyltransferase PlsY [Myxococcaceae bacterium]